MLFRSVLTPGSSIVDSPIYDLTVNPTALQGEYSGTLSIFDPSNVLLATTSFTVTVTPEPGEFLLYGAGLVGLVVWNRRRRAAAMVSRPA